MQKTWRNANSGNKKAKPWSFSTAGVSVSPAPSNTGKRGADPTSGFCVRQTTPPESIDYKFQRPNAYAFRTDQDDRATSGLGHASCATGFCEGTYRASELDSRPSLAELMEMSMG